MKVRMERIRLFGQEYLMSDAAGGAITTATRFARWHESVAHLFPDGRIMRYGQQIGTREDIELLGPVAVELEAEGLDRAAEDLGALVEGHIPPRWRRP